MNCICILKDTTFERLNGKYKDEIEFCNVKTLDGLKQELLVSACDFAILDLNNYNYHDISEYLEDKNIKIHIFNGQFDTIENAIEKEIKNNKNQEVKSHEKEKEVKIVNKYIEIEKEVEVEKIVEIEKVVEKKVYQRVKIGITSDKKGIGCTHYCFTVANFLKERNKSVVIVEIGEYKLKSVKQKNIDLLHFRTLEEYYSDSKVREYDYVIIDLGYFERENFKEIFLQCDFKIAILGSKEYESYNTNKFFAEILKLKIVQDVYYIFNFASKKRFKELIYDIEDFNVYKGIYNEDFEVNEDVEAILNAILQLEENNKKQTFKKEKIILPSIIVVLVVLLVSIIKFI